MRALLLLLLICCLLAGCVDADDTEVAYAPVADDNNRAPVNIFETSAAPDASRTVSYLSGTKWDGWESSPERVKVIVSANERRHTHYFESMPVAYGWLEERYDNYDILELLVANALTGRDLLRADQAYYLLRPGYEHSLPTLLAYPTRSAATAVLDRYPDRYYLRGWDEVDDSIVLWRDRYWDDWRDDFGFTRTASVAHYDGRFWDGWYEAPDRVLVRVDAGGRLATHYFDGLPVAWAWLDDRYDDYEIIDLQIAGADLPGRLLNAREATYLWMPDPTDALPAVLAFATRDDARRALRALGDSGFRMLDWNDLTPRLASWSDEHWNAWRGNPERNRGIARALEAGLGRKLGLRGSAPGVVAGEHRQRERLSDAKDRPHKVNSGNAKEAKEKSAKSSGSPAHRDKVKSGPSDRGNEAKPGKSSGSKAKSANRGKSKGKARIGKHDSGNKARREGGDQRKTSGQERDNTGKGTSRSGKGGGGKGKSRGKK